MTEPPRVRGAGHEAAFSEALDRLERDDVLARIWDRDHTVWRPDPTEIANRLGWLDCPTDMASRVPELDRYGASVRATGARAVVLLGMGGSSLAAEVLARVHGAHWPRADGIGLRVLDSTDPEAVLAVMREHPPSDTVYVVSTKSGGTVETMSFLDTFYQHAASALGERAASRRFVAITDPGSGLEETAARLGFDRIWLNDPDIGGRYSALSHFGLVPAAMLGADVGAVLAGAAEAAESNGRDVTARDASAVTLGAFAAVTALAGRDKLTLLAPPSHASFGGWVEQLVAESTGKDGRGILPVVGETPRPAHAYGPDRAFVLLRTDTEAYPGPTAEELVGCGHPVIELQVAGAGGLGAAFFQWELATAVMGHLLGIHPFDQPNVESAKRETRHLIDAYRKTGRLASPTPNLHGGGLAAVGPADAGSPAAALRQLVDSAAPRAGTYVAIQAFLPPGDSVDALLSTLADRVWARSGAVATTGYGPRYLHSTGQLHKGDAGGGRFVQLTHSGTEDVPIPGATQAGQFSVTFGVLEAAQALGERQALLDGAREVLSIDLGADVAAGLVELIAAL